MLKPLLTAGLALAALAACAPSASAGAGDVVVRFAEGTTPAEQLQAKTAALADVGRPVDQLGFERMELVRPLLGVSVASLVAGLVAQDAVAYAEPDRPRRRHALPDDPLFVRQWEHQLIGTPAAWDAGVGDASIVVAVIDTGVDAAHPDLAANLRPGWDFVEKDAVPQDPEGHGTQVAGIVGARGNDGVGIAGVAWNVSLLPLRVLDGDGEGYVSDTIRAYRRAIDARARIVNVSLGSSEPSAAERDAIASAPSILWVASAGNEGRDNDAQPTYPCNLPLEQVVCVAATDAGDRLASFSNTGATSVDLAAPGAGVIATSPGGTWSEQQGTSFAAPFVAGAAALVAARRPEAHGIDLARALTESAAPLPALAGRVRTGGRLDVAAAVGRIAQAELTPLPAPGGAGGAGGGPGGGTGVAGADRDAPRVTVALAPGSSLRRFLRRGLRASVRCSEACEVVVRLRLRDGRRSLLAARRSGERDSAGRMTLLLSPTAGARARLRRVQRAALALDVTARDGAGNERKIVRALSLRR